MPPAHAACLAMLAPVFTMQPDGARIYAPAGRPLEAGEVLAQPGLVGALELVAAEGRGDVVHAARSPRRCSASTGSPCRAPTSSATSAAGASRSRSTGAGHTLPHARRALGRAGDARAAAAAPRARTRRRACTRCSARSTGRRATGHTTNLVTADADGHVCVLTSSLGLGTGDFLPGLDLQLNSMLGEVDLVLEPLEPGERMQSMMAPSLALDGDGLALAIGSAGGTRLRTALVGVAAGILDEGLEPVDGGRAAALPPRRRRRQRRARRRRARRSAELEAAGLHVRRWPAQHHYFGGVSLIARAGAAGDPRRSGHAAAS